MWWRRLPTTDGLGEVRDGSAEHPPAEEDEGVDRDQDKPRVDGGLDAEEGEADGQREDDGHGQAADYEEPHRRRVLCLAHQPVVARRVPVDGRQEQPAHSKGGGVDGYGEPVVAVLTKQRGWEGHECHEH